MGLLGPVQHDAAIAVGGHDSGEAGRRIVALEDEELQAWTWTRPRPDRLEVNQQRNGARIGLVAMFADMFARAAVMGVAGRAPGRRQRASGRGMQERAT